MQELIAAKNTPGKEGEEDIDVIANFDALKTTYYVQVKFHQGTSGNTALNQAIQAKGVYVRLINGLEFMEMLLDVGLVNIDEAFKR